MKTPEHWLYQRHIIHRIQFVKLSYHKLYHDDEARIMITFQIKYKFFEQRFTN